MRILTLLIIFFAQFLNAQKVYNNCVKTYFKNGKVSTTTCYTENKHSGIAQAFNQQGEKIGEWSIGQMHQIASVHFTYHANGGVHKAQYGSHPDAGIQWYESVTTYNEQGVKVDFWQMSHDDRLTFYDPNQIELPPSNPPPVFENYFTSEFWIDNRTNRAILVRWKPKKDTKFEEVIIAKNERKLLTTHKNNRFVPPLDIYSVEILKTNRKTTTTTLDTVYFVKNDKTDPKNKVYQYSTKTR